MSMRGTLIRGLALVAIGYGAIAATATNAEARFIMCVACGWHTTCDAFEGQQACNAQCGGLPVSGCAAGGWTELCGNSARYLCGTNPF